MTLRDPGKSEKRQTYGSGQTKRHSGSGTIQIPIHMEPYWIWKPHETIHDVVTQNTNKINWKQNGCRTLKYWVDGYIQTCLAGVG